MSQRYFLKESCKCYLLCQIHFQIRCLLQSISLRYIKSKQLQFQPLRQYLPFTGLCKASSSQHEKSNSVCSSVLPFSPHWAALPGLLQSVAVWGSCMGHPDLHLTQAQVCHPRPFNQRYSVLLCFFLQYFHLCFACRQALESLGFCLGQKALAQYLGLSGKVLETGKGYRGGVCEKLPEASLVKQSQHQSAPRGTCFCLWPNPSVTAVAPSG